MDKDNQIAVSGYGLIPEKILELIRHSEYSPDYQKLLEIDYSLNYMDKAPEEFEDYLKSIQVQEEYENIQADNSAGNSYSEFSDERLHDVTSLMNAGDYIGANELIDRKLQSQITNGILRILKIIASFRGKSPATSSCCHIKLILDELAGLSANSEYGIKAALLHNAIALTFRDFHGVSFKLLHPEIKSQDIKMDTKLLFRYLKISESTIKESLSITGICEK